MRLELFDPDAAAELARFLRGRGFVVVRRELSLHVHCTNHVSGRHDRLAVQAAVREWLPEHGCALVYVPDPRVHGGKTAVHAAVRRAA